MNLKKSACAFVSGLGTKTRVQKSSANAEIWALQSPLQRERESSAQNGRVTCTKRCLQHTPESSYHGLSSQNWEYTARLLERAES